MVLPHVCWRKKFCGLDGVGAEGLFNVVAVAANDRGCGDRRR
jgi:hypothetical protein